MVKGNISEIFISLITFTVIYCNLIFWSMKFSFILNLFSFIFRLKSIFLSNFKSMEFLAYIAKVGSGNSRKCSDLSWFPAPSLRNEKINLEKKIFPKKEASKNYWYFGVKPDFTYYPNCSRLLMKNLLCFLKTLSSNLGQFPVPSLKRFLILSRKKISPNFGMTTD